jgi:esterase/lipase
MDAVYGLVNLMDAALDAAAHLDDRALILLGENEDIIPEESIEEMLRRLPAAGAERRRIAVYSAGYHMLLRDLQAETCRRKRCWPTSGTGSTIPRRRCRPAPTATAPTGSPR